MTTADPVVVWQVARRPGHRLLAFASLIASILALGSTALIHALMLEPSWLVAGAWGAGVGSLVVISLWHGSAVRIERDADGAHLIYALRGTDMVRVPVTAISGLSMVDAGGLCGVAVTVPLASITFLSRKGPTRRQCETCQSRLGAPLVLEFLDAGDLASLRSALVAEGALQAHVPPA